MRKDLKFAAILFAVAMTLPASATCEYCKGPGGNRYCSDVTGSHPSGNDQCHAWYGQCTYEGSSCSSGSGGCENEFNACEETQTSLEPDAIELPDGSALILQPQTLCATPDLIIES